MLRSHHRYALQSIYFSGMSNVHWLVGCEILVMYWGGRNLGAVIIGCVVYGFQYGLGVHDLWVSMFDIFWVLFEVVVLGGGFWPQVSIVCVCVRARVAHLHTGRSRTENIIPDAVLIQFYLLMKNTELLETCRRL